MAIVNHSSRTPDPDTSSTRLPSSWADDRNSRLSSLHTGVVMLASSRRGCGWLQSWVPLAGSRPTTRSLANTTTCSRPSTVMRIGEAGAIANSPLRHATRPSFWWNAMTAWPGPPAVAMIRSR